MTKRKRNLYILEAVMLVIAVIWFIPIYYLIVTTLKNPQEATANPLGLPIHLEIGNYIKAWTNMQFPRAFANTLFITATAVVIIVVFGAMAGYALARTKTKMGNRMFLFFLAGLIVPFQMNIVSLYKIVKSLHLMNTPFAVILVNVAINTPQAVFLFKEFIEGTVPKELEEAAEIDGAGEVRIFAQIMLPLCKPAMASVAIFTFINTWSDFMGPMLYLNRQESYTLSIGLQAFLQQHYVQWGILMAASAIFTIPMIVLFFFAQKYFIEGITVTGVKG